MLNQTHCCQQWSWSLTSPSAVVACCFIVLLAGCGQSATQTDEAKKRADAEGVSITDAVEYYSYPRVADDDYPVSCNGKENTSSKQVHYAADESTGPKLYDYFPSMDAVSEVTFTAAPSADQLYDKSGKRQSMVASPKLTANEVIGRNTWMMWCGGNEGFWDWLATDSYGFIDLLKVIDTRTFSTRFHKAGVINEPGMEPSAAASIHYGLWIDVPANDTERRWRDAYLAQTFREIRKGEHKSQVGLTKEYTSGRDVPLFTGDNDAYKGQGYQYPSEYVEPAQFNEKQRAYLDCHVPPPDLYGISSGVIGLRLFPNPYFDKEAQDAWEAEQYYSDDSYYNNPELVRPFRVGMSCAFCHASFHPLKPPLDTAYPNWENISGSIGAQYLSMRATVGGQLEPDNFFYHLLESQPRGTIDTSLVASDNINNANAMNAVFSLQPRALLSLYNPKEELSPQSATLPSLWGNTTPLPGPGSGGQQPPVSNPDPAFADDYVPKSIVEVVKVLGKEAELENSNSEKRAVPRILFDGSDSIGTAGALARVYLNIGTYWEQWNTLHQVAIGFTPQKPFLLDDCEQNSVYWHATKRRVPGLRDYFLKVTPPMPLLSTEKGRELVEEIKVEEIRKKAEETKVEYDELLARERALHIDVEKLEQGRMTFARNCVVCHSSIQPESMRQLLLDKADNDQNAIEKLVAKYENLAKRRNEVRFQAELNGEFYEHNPAQWLQDPEYMQWASDMVTLGEFWRNNFLSTDYRVPVTVVGTNSSRAMATNAMTGHMWQDFASESYRRLPSPGEITYYNPYTDKDEVYSPRHQVFDSDDGRDKYPEGGGGPGYYRVPTLISVWATAPLLHNNSLGLFNNDPSVEGRLLAYDDAIRKLLWPEKRLLSSSYNEATPERLARDHGLIWRTTEKSYLVLDAERAPYLLNMGRLSWLKEIQPLWLPSLLLFSGAFVLFVLGNHRHRRLLACVVLVVAVPLVIALVASYIWPTAWGLSWLANRVAQLWLPAAVLLLMPYLLWLRLTARWTRYFAYGLIASAVLIGFAVYFNAGRLGNMSVGPIPKGTPVNLIANFNPEAPLADQLAAVTTALDGLAEIDSRHLDGEDMERVMKEKVAPALLSVNKCPDFVMDRGHYFPWFDSMSDEDKESLIELLKTF